MPRAFNVSTFKVGGLRFVKLGRITIMFCVSRPKVEAFPAPRQLYRTTDDGVILLGYRDE